MKVRLTATAPIISITYKPSSFDMNSRTGVNSVVNYIFVEIIGDPAIITHSAKVFAVGNDDGKENQIAPIER
jgi:hypothetical protein